MEFLVFWLVAAIAVGIVATARHRSGFGWFVLSVLISPLLAGVLLLIVGRGVGAHTQPAITAETHRNCPECREVVRRDARKCKHCGSALTPG